MLKALESVVTVLAMIGLGFGLAKRGWFGAGGSSLLARLVVSVALPAYMVSNFMGGYDRAKLLSMLPGLPLPFATMLGSYVLARAIARIAGVKNGRKRTFATMVALSNTIFIGLPVNTILFGDQSLPFVLLYYIGNTVTFWTIGVYGIAKDGAELGGRATPRLLSVESIRRIFSPPLVFLIGSIAMILLGVRPPDFILKLCGSVGAMTTPLSMLFVGIALSQVVWRDLRSSLDMGLLLVGRFAVAPAILLALALPRDLPPLMKQVFLIQASMPVMTQIPILAATYGADAEYAGMMTSITTVASLAVIPAYMSVIAYIF
jgi:predicted permease